jgi:3'-phosphoadenosine 5'-phosphosulfate sulfotransferase (PAPS reductase)/FAD synthetase
MTMIEMMETPNLIEPKSPAPCFQVKRLVSVPNRPTAHVVSVSGGKDSAVTLALAVERCPLGSVFPIFCDTGNEHPFVYQYLDYLEARFGVKIARLSNDFAARIEAKRKFIARDQRKGRGQTGKKLRWTNKSKRRALEYLHPTGGQFLDLCLWKGRFPSRKAQFCTENLKKIPAVAYQMEKIDQGDNVISWQGVRRDESHNRRNAKKIERISDRLYAFRPIVEWTAAQVFEYHASHQIEPNPLYKMGMSRVGCMPCINVNKKELMQISERFPSEIDRVSTWEKLVSLTAKQGGATMMYGPSKERNPNVMFSLYNIRKRVEWARTAKNWNQYEMFPRADTCSSAYGLCE